MASTWIKRDLSVSETVYKYTWSAWIKRTGLGVAGDLFKTRIDGNNWVQAYLHSNNRLVLQSYKNGGYHYDFMTTQAFRDTFGWYHFVFNVDSSQSSASDRVRIYVNGERITEFSTSNNNLTNGDSLIINGSDSGQAHTIGSWNNGSYFEGLMSHVHYSSGYSYDPTTFGSTDSTTGEWKINTSPNFTLGGNGYSVLKDGITITDQSSNSNDFTVGGGTLTKTEDCPSNVFATLNPLDKAIVGTDPTFANGNTKWTSSGNNTSNNAVQGTIGASSGKYYFEIKATTANYLFVGMRNQNVTPSWDATGYSANNTGFYGVNNEGKKIVGGTGTNSIFTQISNNDIFCCAYDLDNKKFWVRTNDGAWYASGNPVTGANSLGTLADGTYLPIVFNGHYSYASACECNFGNGYFGTTQISSEGTNASGIGKFEYDVPTGYTALCTKGLNE